MKTMTNENFRHICRLVEQKTGVSLGPDRMHERRHRARLVPVLAVLAVMVLTMTASAFMLFTPMNGDELALGGIYEGNGIITVWVENGSDKYLRFQKQVMVMEWEESRELPGLSGKVIFRNTVFPPHSGGAMTLDLSGAYDTDLLEREITRGNLYLVLTNYDFQFGHDWMCFIRFPQEGTK